MDVVLNWLWQGVVVAAVLFVLLRFLDDVPAKVRYIVCSLALLVVLTIPVLRSLSSTSSANDLPMHTAHAPAGPVVAVPVAPWTSAAAMLGLWLVWAGAQGFRVSRALVGLRRARRTCRPFPAEIEQRLRHWMRVRGERRQARLVLSDGVGRAAVLGCGAPIIAVAPALVDRLSADELDYVVIHEWAHVQRRDDLVNLLQLAVRVVAGWHPAVWWIERCLQVEREVACDEMAVAIGGSAKSYASCLVKLSDMSAMTPVSLAAPSVLTGGRLRHRITRIVSGRPLSSLLWSGGLGTAVVAGLVTVAAVIAGFDLFATAVTPPAHTRTISRSTPPERLPAPRLAAAPIATTQRTRATSAAPPRRDAARASDAPAQTVGLSPADVSGLSVPVAQLHERDEQHGQVETPQAVAAAAPTVASDAPGPAADADAPPSIETQADSRSPWVAAGDAGAAIGRRSKAAGVATAGAFSRFARRVAGSF